MLLTRKICVGRLGCSYPLYAAADILRSRGVLGISTDTVNGLVGIYDLEVIQKIHHLKQRNLNKPFLLLLYHIDQVSDFAIVGEEQWPFLRLYWPGPHTFLLRKSPHLAYPKDDTIAVRVPSASDSLFLKTLLKKCGPLLAPSLNIHGREPLEKLGEIIKQFGNDLQGIFLEPKKVQKPSTIWKFENTELRRVRN